MPCARARWTVRVRCACRRPVTCSPPGSACSPGRASSPRAPCSACGPSPSPRTPSSTSSSRSVRSPTGPPTRHRRPDLRVPPTRALAPWSALTPPRGPWEPVGALPGDLLASVARDGVAEVAAAVRERGAAAGFARDRVWSRDVREAAGPHPDLLTADGMLTDGDRGAHRRGVRGIRPRLPCSGEHRPGPALQPVDEVDRPRRPRRPALKGRAPLRTAERGGVLGRPARLAGRGCGR